MSQPSLLSELSAISSDRTDRTVTLDGDEMRMRYSPEPGIDLRIEATDPDDPDRVVVATTYEAHAERPAGYPPAMPYLPGLKASVTVFPGGAAMSVAWFAVPDAEAAAAEILAQGAAAGWKSAGSEEMDVANVRIIEMTRAGLRRSVIVSSFDGNGTLMLIDKPADA
jgi:hypothetical protein